MLEVIGVNFNIKLNGLIKMKIKNGMIQQDLRIPRKLFKIFTLVILKSSNLEY